MSDELDYPNLNLTDQEKRAFPYLFNQADTDQLGVVTGERAVTFFEKTRVSPNVLGEIWQIADTENRGLLTKSGFYQVLRLIGHYQSGREPSTELAFKPSPIPRFEGLQVPGVGPVASPTTGGFPASALQPQLSGQGPIRVPPLDPQRVQQYSGLFERSGAQNGMLDGVTAKNLFERFGLPNEILGRIWNLADRQQRGALDQTEFIIAMHLLTSMKNKTMSAVPNTLSPGLYEAALRRGIPPPPGSRSGPQAPVPRQFTGGSAGAPPRTQSPLARSPAYAAPVQQAPTSSALPWLITQQDKARYDQFFASIDPQGRGVISGEQAVPFFSNSRLPEDTLASIWDLADINSGGQLSRDEFAVAMYLIKQQRAPNPPPLPAFLPPALVPPSMRQQQQQTQQSTAPAFDNVSNQPTMPKSATEDLFGLDEPAPAPQQPQATGFPPPAGLQAQTTGASLTRDPFGGSIPSSPSSPRGLQGQNQQQGSVFKPFMPTSAFGASLAQQHTGGSTTSSQGQAPRSMQPQQQPPSHLQQANTMDDLLGDNDTHAEESRNITNDSTELANLSNQIGNLSAQMEQTQTRKAATQADVTATNNQKRDLELRLQQFRSQYEQEVRTVKELDAQLATSRESTKKLGQELAMVEGTYQDLQTQHNTTMQALQADQQENATLKQRISEVNAEVAKLKPELEKMKLDARQQKGLVSINKKQLTTNESERDRLQGEKTDLEREAAEREEQARSAPQEQPSNHLGRDAAIGAGVGAAAFGAYEATKDREGSRVASPSAMGSMNPFFRQASTGGATERAVSPPAMSSAGPNPRSFDDIFGPSAAFGSDGQHGGSIAPPPATSFGRSPATSDPSAPQQTGMTDSVQSVSSVGEPTPSATPPLSEQAKESPIASNEPPPPPENRQFTPSQLPLQQPTKEESDASSTMVVPPASRAGDVPSERDAFGSRVASPAPESAMPGTFAPPPPETPLPEPDPGAFPTEDEEPTTSAREVQEEPAEEQTAAAPSTTVNDDFDSAFASFGQGEKTKDASGDPFGVPESQPQSRGLTSEFPPIQSLEPEDEESEDEPEHDGFADGFNPSVPGGVGGMTHGAAEPTPTAPLTSDARDIPDPTMLSVRPAVTSVASTASAVPSIGAQSSPPTYEESNEPSHGGSGERTESNHFPPEFGGLLPARNDPTSASPPPQMPEHAVVEQEQSRAPPDPFQMPERSGTGSSMFQSIATPSSGDVFHDANSRPISSVTDASPPRAAQTNSFPAQGQANNAFDDFDEFGDLSEAKEADKTGSDFDFGFGRQHPDEFNPAFDSPAASMTNTMASSQQTPVPSNRQVESNGFPNFQSSHNGGSSSPFGGSSSLQQTPQNPQHDWDAIFSGLDSSKNVDTSLTAPAAAEDPWGTAASSTAHENIAPSSNGLTPTSAAPAPMSKAARMGRALTPGTEHDDPILKRLTGMGYPRVEALNALEKYDYDINKAVDHLTGA